MNHPNPLVELRHVAKRYDSPDSAAGPLVLKDVCLTMAAGESLAVVGPSGCGKSTLLNLVGTLDSPSAGAVLLDGQDLAGLDESARCLLRADKIGFVFQRHHLLGQLSVLENVLAPVLARPGGSTKEAAPRAAALLERVGLQNRMDYGPGQLSGGECQRVAVVRAMINQPRLLLADEPTGSLDRAAAEALADLLAELPRRDGVTLLVVTHSQPLAARMARVMQLQDGVLTEAAATHT